MHEQLQQSVREIVELLTAGKYAEVEVFTNGIRLSAREMAKAINDYGRRLAIPPEEAFQLMDVVEVRNANPPRWSVTMPLWTHEVGRSDLSLELTVVADPNGFRMELDDIHVL